MKISKLKNKLGKRMTALLLTVAMLLCILPAMSLEVSAATGYDRGYTGSMAGDGRIYAHGLDVSAWQESGLNFQNFANAGYDYVILRCGTSYGKDKCFEEYYNSARAAGLDVGCYYYSYATSTAKAVAEAKEMISWMGNKKFEYPIYFDYEDPSQSSISGSVAAQICYSFMDTLKASGYLVGLYSMASWLEQSWVTSSGLRTTYEGWVAHLATEANNSGISSSYYDDLLGKYGKRYGMHQYSFSTYVNGAGPFDANVSFKDYPSIVKKYGFNGYSGGAAETWIEQACFDVMVYRDRNPDLAGMTDAQLKSHWLSNGIKEGRASSVILDLGFYLANNKDLKDNFGNDYEKAYNHFITSGYKEGRKSSAVFDGSYYCERYPEVASSFKDEYLRHYMENGMKEGRRASLTFDPDYYWHIRPDVAQTWPGNYEMCARHYAGHGVNAQVEAYDHSLPVITNAKITNISTSGYTVTCTVSDDWEVVKVAFPTWTVNGGQDDLADDFMNTQQGTKSGNTYTFQVKASQHNYETGSYVTHIYAVDRGGNQAQLMLNEVTLTEPASQTITLNTSSSYSIKDSFLMNVGSQTSVTALLSQFKTQGLKVRDTSGASITGSTVVGTGMTVNLTTTSGTMVTLTVVVGGDVDGNGVVDTTDYMRIKSNFMGYFSMSRAEAKAADVDSSGKVDSTDYMQLKSAFLGGYYL